MEEFPFSSLSSLIRSYIFTEAHVRLFCLIKPSTAITSYLSGSLSLLKAQSSARRPPEDSLRLVVSTSALARRPSRRQHDGIRRPLVAANRRLRRRLRPRPVVAEADRLARRVDDDEAVRRSRLDRARSLKRTTETLHQKLVRVGDEVLLRETGL